MILQNICNYIQSSFLCLHTTMNLHEYEESLLEKCTTSGNENEYNETLTQTAQCYEPPFVSNEMK